MPHKKKSFTRVHSKHVRKTDYIDKTVKDQKTGYLGEKLTLAYEKDRLESIGLADYKEQVKWVSQESDLYGYDILSYDLDDFGKIVHRYIEVKATTQKTDADFYVSKNELETSKRLNNYWVYRIYDIEAEKPKFYRVLGDIEKNFNLEPQTYRVQI